MMVTQMGMGMNLGLGLGIGMKIVNGREDRAQVWGSGMGWERAWVGTGYVPGDGEDHHVRNVTIFRF